MALDTRHPDYNDFADDWRMLRHARRGTQAVKHQTTRYLPMPTGFKAQPDNGTELYTQYIVRALFPDILRPTLLGMVGLIHRIEAKIELPAQLEYLQEKATPEGLPLEAFHRTITEEILLQGRYGVFVDIPNPERHPGAQTGLPMMLGYVAETIINWSEELDMFALDESEYRRNGFEWMERTQYRGLTLENGVYTVHLQSDEFGTSIEQVMPGPRGGGTLDVIPFVIVGPTGVRAVPEPSPLIGVAESALAIYRLDADYRHQLYYSGQETLFTIGLSQEQQPKYLGAGVSVGLPEGGDAKYVGPSGSGIDAHKQAMTDQRAAAIAAGARVLDIDERGPESGEALRLRHGAQAASLMTVAISSAQALERSLRFAAMYLGADPESVVVTPNLKFVETKMDAAEAAALVGVWQQRGISWETLYENLQRGEIASVERTAEEERTLIEADDLLGPTPAEIAIQQEEQFNMASNGLQEGQGEPPPEEQQ